MKMSSLLATLVILSISLNFSHAQTTATWQGGHGGKVTDWNCSANWKEGKVPDEFSLVVIPSDRLFYPVLNSNVIDIDALYVESDATLTVEAGGSIAILNETGRVGGLFLMGTIINDGKFEINHSEDLSLALQRIHSTGTIRDSILQVTLR